VQRVGQQAGHAGPTRAGQRPFLADDEEAIASVAEPLPRVVGIDTKRDRRPEAAIVPEHL